MKNENLTHHSSLFIQKHIFIGKSKFCKLTEFSSAGDKIDFDGNTILLECENNENSYISGLEIFQFKTDDKIRDYISLMGNNMIPYTFAIGKILHVLYQLIKNFLKMIKLKKVLC